MCRVHEVSKKRFGFLTELGLDLDGSAQYAKQRKKVHFVKTFLTLFLTGGYAKRFKCRGKCATVDYCTTILQTKINVFETYSKEYPPLKAFQKNVDRHIVLPRWTFFLPRFLAHCVHSTGRSKPYLDLSGEVLQNRAITKLLIEP